MNALCSEMGQDSYALLVGSILFMYLCIHVYDYFSFEEVVIRLLQNSVHTESDFSKAMHYFFAVEGILKLSFFRL